MKCLRPTQFNNAHGNYISCGQCMPCRITRRSEWTTKLMLEWKTFKDGVFVTLTYAPDYLPDKEYFKGGSLNKSDLQKFLKRFRFNYQNKYGKTKIRHFAVGEYGDKSQRAHYHILLFNVDIEFAEETVEKSWTLGLTQTDPLHENRIKYTVGYTIKKLTSLQHYPDGRVPEFSIQSKNPALGWYQIPMFAKLLFKHNLYPSRSVSQEHNWILEQEGYDLIPWSGVFFTDKDGNIEFPLAEDFKPSPGATYNRLDTSFMKKLGQYMTPLLTDYLEAREELLTPKAFKSRRERLTHHSYFDKIKFEEGEDYEQTQKKSEKIKRRHNKAQQI